MTVLLNKNVCAADLARTKLGGDYFPNWRGSRITPWCELSTAATYAFATSDTPRSKDATVGVGGSVDGVAGAPVVFHPQMRVGRRSSMLSRGPGEGGGYGRLYILEAVSALSWCCDDWRTFGLPARYRLAKCGA